MEQVYISRVQEEHRLHQSCGPLRPELWAGVFTTSGLLWRTRKHWSSSPREVYPKAKWAAEKAVEFDPVLADFHAPLGPVKLFYEWDWLVLRENSSG